MSQRKFKNLHDWCEWRLKHDRDYAALCRAIAKGYRGEKNPFVMSMADAKRFANDPT